MRRVARQKCGKFKIVKTKTVQYQNYILILAPMSTRWNWPKSSDWRSENMRDGPSIRPQVLPDQAPLEAVPAPIRSPES